MRSREPLRLGQLYDFLRAPQPDLVRRRLHRHLERRGQLRWVRERVPRRPGVHRRSLWVPLGRDGMRRPLRRPRARLFKLWELWPCVRAWPSLLERGVWLSCGVPFLRWSVRRPADEQRSLWKLRDPLSFDSSVLRGPVCLSFGASLLQRAVRRHSARCHELRRLREGLPLGRHLQRREVRVCRGKDAVRVYERGVQLRRHLDGSGQLRKLRNPLRRGPVVRLGRLCLSGGRGAVRRRLCHLFERPAELRRVRRGVRGRRDVQSGALCRRLPGRLPLVPGVVCQPPDRLELVRWVRQLVQRRELCRGAMPVHPRTAALRRHLCPQERSEPLWVVLDGVRRRARLLSDRARVRGGLPSRLRRLSGALHGDGDRSAELRGLRQRLWPGGHLPGGYVPLPGGPRDLREPLRRPLERRGELWLVRAGVWAGRGVQRRPLSLGVPLRAGVVRRTVCRSPVERERLRPVRACLPEWRRVLRRPLLLHRGLGAVRRSVSGPPERPKQLRGLRDHVPIVRVVRGRGLPLSCRPVELRGHLSRSQE